MALLLNFTNPKHRQLALAIATATGFATALPGCGIPCLRGPKPAPALPQTYQEANNWKPNPVSYTAHATTTATVPAADETLATGNPATDEHEAAAIKVNGAGVQQASFAAFGKNASTQELDAADELAEDATDDVGGSLAEKIKANRDEVGKADGDYAVDLSDASPKASDDSTGLQLAESNLDFGATAMDFGVTSFENSAQVGWNQFFNDPYLATLIGQALTGNQELRILSEEINVASNEVLSRSGEYFPFLNLGLGAGVEKSGRHTRGGAVEDQLQVAPGRDFPDPLPNFLVAGNLSWEIDIWRRLRNAKDAACLRYLGTRDGWNYVVTRMVADVAENYYELLALDNRLEILDRTIAIQEQSLETSTQMKDAARGTELAVQRFQAEVRKNQSEKLIIQQQIVEAENRINFLLGRYPQPVERIQVDYLDLNLYTLSAGVPPQLLQNRSDIRQAERELAAAGLDVKVAKARFYPSLVLTAGVGYNAFDPGYLFRTPESLIYSLGGDLIAPLVNKRAIKAAYMSANARQLQALYEYQRTVLNAYTEVVNQLSKVENYRQSIEVKKQQLTALELSVDSATKLFQNARAEYVEVLLAQRDMMEARMVLVETKQQQLTAIVGAYQALGGGGVNPIVQSEVPSQLTLNN